MCSACCCCQQPSWEKGQAGGNARTAEELAVSFKQYATSQLVGGISVVVNGLHAIPPGGIRLACGGGNNGSCWAGQVASTHAESGQKRLERHQRSSGSQLGKPLLVFEHCDCRRNSSSG
jgi:hypothetical protein